MDRNVVVLPAPFGPSSATTSPCPTCERHPEQRLGLAVEGLDAGDFQDHGGVPRTERCTHLFSRSAVGRAARDHLPPVDDRDRVGEPEQELHVVLDDHDGIVALQVPHEAPRAARCPRCRVPKWARRGRAGAARRRARRRSPARAVLRTPYSPARRCSSPARPTRARTAEARSAAALSASRRSNMLKPRERTSGSATRTFSSAEYSSNRLMIWNERAMPLRAIGVGGEPGDVLAVEHYSAPVGLEPSRSAR